MTNRRDLKAGKGAAAASVEPASGLIVCGTGFACGKTTLMTGIASTLKSEGFSIRAIKPICVGKEELCQAELSFISSISQSPLTYPIQFINGGSLLDTFQLKEAVRVCKRGADVSLVEMPGSVATPVAMLDGQLLDVAEFACEIKWPVLLVARVTPSFYEQVIVSTTYLQYKGLTVLGLVAVETVPTKEQDNLACPGGSLALALKEKTNVNFLGSLGYSPSIDVANVKQGNLIKTTSAGVDLLPIIKGLRLSLSV